jgi:hypothetical protein
MTIEIKIEKYYSQLLDKDTKKKICELNSNLYGIGTETEDFNFMKYAKEVSEKISELPEMYYNSFYDFWCDNIDDIEEENFEEWYLIKLENIKEVLLGTELANTI